MFKKLRRAIYTVLVIALEMLLAPPDPQEKLELVVAIVHVIEAGIEP